MKALVLDFGGVISRTVFETHNDSEKALGLPQGTLTWRGPFDVANDDLWRSMQEGKISEREYWFTRAAETGKLVGENWTSLPQFLQRIRGENPNAMIRPEFLSAIEKAKKAGIVLAILSNELDLFYGVEFRKKLPFLDDFNLIIDATYTKILKPDPRSYALITDGLGLKPADCLFVDDQIRNVNGAKIFGMNTLHFDVTNPSLSYFKVIEMTALIPLETIHA